MFFRPTTNPRRFSFRLTYKHFMIQGALDPGVGKTRCTWKKNFESFILFRPPESRMVSFLDKQELFWNLKKKPYKMSSCLPKKDIMRPAAGPNKMNYSNFFFKCTWFFRPLCIDGIVVQQKFGQFFIISNYNYYNDTTTPALRRLFLI